MGTRNQHSDLMRVGVEVQRLWTPPLTPENGSDLRGGADRGFEPRV